MSTVKKSKDVFDEISLLLTTRLTQRYGKGFSSQNLWYMIQLYETHPVEVRYIEPEFKKLMEG